MRWGIESPPWPGPPALPYISITMLQPITAIVIGSGLGFLITVAGQKQLNAQQVSMCTDMDYHRVITIRSWIGTAKYCMHIKYLAQ